MTNKQTQFTPGPWHVGELHSYDRIVIASDGASVPLAEVFGKDEANARLIAAAPKLYEALRSIFACYEEGKPILSSEWATARAVLAKVTP